MTIEEVEPLVPKRKILLSGYEHDTTMSYQAFIKNFIKIYNQQYNTVNDSRGQGIQCYRSCRRSLGDIFRVTRIFYPDVTIRQVKEYLLELNNSKEISTQYCYTINRMTYYDCNQPRYHHQHTTKKDEFGMYLNDL